MLTPLAARCVVASGMLLVYVVYVVGFMFLYVFVSPSFTIRPSIDRLFRVLSDVFPRKPTLTHNALPHCCTFALDFR